MNDCIAQLIFMFRLWLCLALGFVAFLAVAHFTNMSEGMTTAGWCVAHRKGFAWKECRKLTPKERNIDFAEGVAMATAKKFVREFGRG